jgi:nucleotide-binding universal stress UspA family protein
VISHDPYRRVAVALDGSERALRALPTARGVARLFGADLWLVTVADAVDAQARLARARQVAGAGAVREVILGGGDPAAVLGRFDDEHPEVLLCMSTRGRSPLRQAVLGAVASAVVRHSNQALVLVGPSCRHDLDEFTGFLIVCLDGKPGGESVLPWVDRWARSSGLTLAPLRVTYPLVEPEARIPPSADQFEELAYSGRITRQLEAAGHRVVDLSHADPDPATAIVRAAERAPGSILAMASTDRHPVADTVLGSTSGRGAAAQPRPGSACLAGTVSAPSGGAVGRVMPDCAAGRRRR